MDDYIRLFTDAILAMYVVGLLFKSEWISYQRKKIKYKASTQNENFIRILEAIWICKYDS